jgi:hypothetical protein
VPKQVATFPLCTLRTLPNVRFTPESGHWLSALGCPLNAKADQVRRNKLPATRSPRRRLCGSGVRGRSAAFPAWRPVLADQ